MRQGGSRDELREMLAVGDRRLELDRVVEHAELVRLDRDVLDIDRPELFRVAAEVFGRRLDRPTRPLLPDLSADHFARPLFVLAAALRARPRSGSTSRAWPRTTSSARSWTGTRPSTGTGGTGVSG